MEQLDNDIVRNNQVLHIAGIKDVAGITVLFNPKPNVIEKIASYIDQIDRLYIVDNSDKLSLRVVDQIKYHEKITYITNNGNLGLAKALNIGAQMAIKHGYRYLLTMDQDSTATPCLVNVLLACFNKKSNCRIGIVSPFHMIKNNDRPKQKTSCHEVLTVWTSGNILNLNAFTEVGPFWDELFIDFIDHEYCLRLNSQGYKVMESNDAILVHEFGNKPRKYNVFGFTIIVSNHTPLRRYYITRNRFIVIKKYKKAYPAFYYADLIRFYAEFVTILFCERDKLQKMRMIFKGIQHSRQKKLGSYQEE